MSWVVTMSARLPEELQKAQNRAVRNAALIVTRGIRDEVRALTGDMRLSGVGYRGARIGARFQTRGGVNPSALIRATGPAHLVEHPSAPHRIEVRNPRKRREGGRASIRLRDGSFAKGTNHPGVPRPRKPYERGYLRTRDQAGEEFDRTIQDAIRRAMR